MNKLKWFTHDNDAHEDEFLQGAMDRFGHFGYAAYFILIELLHRHGKGNICEMSMARVCQKLRSRRAQVRLYLDFSRGSGRILSTEVGEKLTFEIPKFLERQKKLRFNGSPMVPQRFRNSSQHKKEKEKENTTTTPTAFRRLMDEFLVECLELDPKDKDAISAGYRRYGKAAKDLLAFAGGDADIAIRGLHAIGASFNRRSLSWTLETVAKHFPDYKQNPEAYAQSQRR